MARGKTLHMETTQVSVSRTCADMEALLIACNVTQIWKSIKNGEIEGLAFVYKVGDNDIPFRLPFRWKAIQDLATRGKTGYKKTADQGQAKRVAARIVLRWIEAQVALIEVGMADFAEVFMPYVMVDESQTFHERLQSGGGLQNLITGKGPK